MPINPAEFSGGQAYTIPNQPGPSPVQLLMSLAQGINMRKQSDKKQKEAEITNAFPHLISAGMVNPGGIVGQPNVIQQGGAPWTITPGAQDWTKTNAMLTAQEKQRELSLPPDVAYGLKYAAQAGQDWQMKKRLMPESSMMDKIPDFNALVQEGANIYRTATGAQASSAAPTAAQMIKVRRKSDKQTGSIPLATFDPKKYERI